MLRWQAASCDPAVAGQFVLDQHRDRRAGATPSSRFDFSVLYVAEQFQLRAADVLSRRGAVGRARRLAAAVGVDARAVDAGGGASPAAICRATLREPRAGRARRRELRFPAVHCCHFESVRAARSRARGRTRPESRCCRIRRSRSIRRCSTRATSASRVSVCVRLRRDARGQDSTRRGRAGRGRGPSTAWAFLTVRHRARQLVGVLRTRLGRLVVLGSGGKRFVHALARGHGADSLAGSHRQARPVQELDAAAVDPARSR